MAYRLLREFRQAFTRLDTPPCSIRHHPGSAIAPLVALDQAGQIVLRRKLTRRKLVDLTATLKSTLIGMEACGGAHFLARLLHEQGHDARIIPPQFVKPFVKSQKNDFLDAEAIAEAVQRPTMRFVPVKTEEQLDMQTLHRVRDCLVGCRTALINRSAPSCSNAA